MHSGEFFQRFADNQEIGRDITDTHLSVFFDNGREVGLWREERRTTQGEGEILSDENAAMARYWYVPDGRKRPEAGRSGWLDSVVNRTASRAR